jgi:hypothetical protein
MLPEPVPGAPFAAEPLLLDELNHRIINEFTSAIVILDGAAARSDNDEIKDGLEVGIFVRGSDEGSATCKFARSSVILRGSGTGIDA